MELWANESAEEKMSAKKSEEAVVIRKKAVLRHIHSVLVLTSHWVPTLCRHLGYSCTISFNLVLTTLHDRWLFPCYQWADQLRDSNLSKLPVYMLESIRCCWKCNTDAKNQEKLGTLWSLLWGKRRGTEERGCAFPTEEAVSQKLSHVSSHLILTGAVGIAMSISQPKTWKLPESRTHGRAGKWGASRFKCRATWHKSQHPSPRSTFPPHPKGTKANLKGKVIPNVETSTGTPGNSPA